MSFRQKRHFRAISQMGNDAKKQKMIIEAPAVTEESDVEESDDESLDVDIADIPESELFDISKMEDRSSDSSTFRYQRGPEVSTWTKWRRERTSGSGKRLPRYTDHDACE